MAHYIGSSPEQIAECSVIALDGGLPMVTISKNIKYLMNKYEVKKNDVKGVFDHVRLSHATLHMIGRGTVNNISIFVLTLFVVFLRRKYGAQYAVGDLLFDIESRERLEGF